jgi:hypothetical protein
MSKTTTPINFGDVEFNGHTISIPTFLIKKGKPVPDFVPNGKSRCRKCNIAVSKDTAVCTGKRPNQDERKTDGPAKSPHDSRPRGGYVRGANQRRNQPKDVKTPHNLVEAGKLCQDLVTAATGNESELFGALRTLSLVSGELQKLIRERTEALEVVTKSLQDLRQEATKLLYERNPVDAQSQLTFVTHVPYVSEDESESESVSVEQSGNDNAEHAVKPSWADQSEDPVVKGDPP